MTKQPVTKEMTIGDAIKAFPEIAEVMLGYGLQCVGCAINPYETIEQGARGHGMDDMMIGDMLKQINFMVTKEPDYELNPLGLTISPIALDMLKEMAETEGRDEVKVEVTAKQTDHGIEYGLDFADAAKDEQKEYDWQGIKVFISDESLQLVNPSVLDYLTMKGEEGFKFISLNKEERCACNKPMSQCGCEGNSCSSGASEGGCCGGGCGC